VFVPRTAFAVLVAGLCVAAPAGAVEVTGFNGSATDLGIQREPGGTGGVEYRIRADFEYDGTIDLRSSTITFLALLNEVDPGGVGELITMRDDVGFLPFSIPSTSRSSGNEALYETPNFRPQFRMTVKQKRGSQYEFRLKLDRGLSRKVPGLCTGHPPGQTTSMLHRFIIDDGVNEPLVISTVQVWDCSNLEGFQLKARQKPGVVSPPVPTPGPTPPGGPSPTPGGVGGTVPPRADLRVEPVSRHTGTPDPIELDGTRSTDADGTIVRYRFDSGNGQVQDGPEPKAVFTYAPGDYRATLTVWDDDGRSHSTSRGFSDK